MKKFLLLFNFLLINLLCFSLQAQTEPDTTYDATRNLNFFDKLKYDEENKGKITLQQDARLTTLLLDKARINKKDMNKDYIVMNGYRVQVYSNNTPRTSKSEAYKIESDIKNKLPEMDTYVSFTSPFWKVRVGDCRTYEEAFSLLNKLKNDFPGIRNEVYIVKENIRISLK